MTGSDDNFTRQTAILKYIAAVRNISLPAQLVRNIEDAEKVAEKGATLEIVGKANLALYYGDSKTHTYQWNGLGRQITDWVTANTADQGILYDAGGQPLGKELLEDIMALSRLKYGKASLLLEGVQSYADTQKLLFPAARYPEGETSGSFGVHKKKFESPYGGLKLEADPMLRPNRPLAAEGAGVTGKPRAVADTGSTDFASDPFTFTAAAAGTTAFWLNATANSDASAVTKPSLPTGEGNQGYRMPVATYYYGASVVFQGKEGTMWVGGASATNSITSATGTPTTSTNTTIKLALAAAAITSLGTTYPRNQLKVRIYRYGGPGLGAPALISDFDFLMETAFPLTSNTACYDNGFNIPGAAEAFAITESKNGAKGWFMAQLLPLMKREGLPEYVMGSPLAMLWFASPILLVPRHHIYIRNIGRA